LRSITAADAAYVTTLEKGGRITAASLLTDAKDPASPLHTLFDWDQERAAEAHWLDRAREILASCRVLVHTTHYVAHVPLYVKDTGVGPTTPGYIRTDLLKENDEAAKKAVLAEVQRSQAMLERTRDVILAVGLEGEYLETVQEWIEELRAFAAEVRNHIDQAA